MPSIIVSLAELGFTAHGCYRNGECEKCHVETTTWFWRDKWLCDNCVFEAIVVVDPRTRTDGGDPIPAGTFLLLHRKTPSISGLFLSQGELADSRVLQ